MESRVSFLHTQGKNLCGMILKHAICVFHGILATLPEAPLSQVAVLDEIMPVIVSL